MTLDIGFFKPNPIYNFYPSISENYWNKYSELPKSTLALQFINIDKLINNSDFLIDTIYFHNYLQKIEKYKDYRRIFAYNDNSQIMSVVSEEFLNKKWQWQQKTEITYNENGVSKINYFFQNETTLTEHKIVFKYDSLGNLEEEIGNCENKNNGCRYNNWVCKYSVLEGKLIKEQSFYYGNYDSSEYISSYNFQDNKLVTYDIGFSFGDSLFSKKIYEYDNENRLVNTRYFEFSDSVWQVYLIRKFGYTNDSAISTITDSSFSSSYHGKLIYVYDDGILKESISYQKELLNAINDWRIVSKTNYEYNDDNYLTRVVPQIIKENNINPQRISYERDEYNNIVKIKNDIWRNNEWIKESETRIIYKKKI